MQAFGGSRIEIAAAWLHDSIEDTATTPEEIERLFSPAVADIVSGLTDDPEFFHATIFQRKLNQAARIRDLGRSQKLIKLADQLSNIRAIIADPPRHLNIEDCRDYLRGALLVAKQCREANEKLFSEFMKAQEPVGR